MKNKINLWNRSGCLSQDAILALTSKTLTNADKHLVEKHLEECILCKEAAEGFSTQSIGNANSNIENLNSAFQNRHGKRNSSSKRIIVSLAAALIIALIGIFSLVRYNRPTFNIQELSESNKNQNAEGTLAEIKHPQQVPSSPEISTEYKAKKEYKSEDMNIQDTEETNVLPAVSASEGYFANDIPEKEVESISENDTRLQEESIAYESSIASNDKNNKTVTSSPLRYAKKALSIEKQANSETVFYNVEQSALFNGGGIDKFRSYIENKLTLAAKENQVSTGSVTVNFTIDSKGFTKDILIVQSINAKTDSIVISFIKNSPGWTPAKQKGKAVNVNMVLPLKIRSL